MDQGVDSSETVSWSHSLPLGEPGERGVEERNIWEVIPSKISNAKKKPSPTIARRAVPRKVIKEKACSGEQDGLVQDMQ